MPESPTIPVIMATTMATQQWTLNLPTRVVVQAIIAKIISTPEMNFREQDDNGRRVPYRLMWTEGDRLLQETETLEQAGVQPNHTLIMTHQARAGADGA
jgi:hypothetical protein